MVADQLRSRRKTATIRLGDKSAKYKKGMVVQVLVGSRYGPREKVFDAVIDKVEVKQLARSLSARDRARQPGDPSPGRDGELARPALQPAEVGAEDTVTVIRFSEINGRVGESVVPRPERSRAGRLHDGTRDGHRRRLRIGASEQLRRAELRRRTPRTRPRTPSVKRASHDGQRQRISPPHWRAGRRQLGLPLLEVALRVAAREAERRPSRRASCAAPPSASRRLYPRDDFTRSDISHR